MGNTMFVAALLIASIAGAAAQAVPTGAPTGAPTPSAAPTAPAPTPVPTTGAAVPTGTPTLNPTLPPSCTDSDKYRAPGGVCGKCISSLNPYKQTIGGSTCVNPTTLSDKSVRCSPYYLPAFVRKTGTSKTVTSCIPQSLPKNEISILLPTKSTIAPFLEASSYRKPSLRLSSDIGSVRAQQTDGLVTFVIKGDRRLIKFNDRFRVIRKQAGSTVRLTGTLRPYNGATVLRCFTAFIKVC